MTTVTHTELQNLIDTSSLTAGETYVVSDYGNYTLATEAVSENAIAYESYNYAQRDSLLFHYVPATNTVDYMKDTERLIEGNFDWTDNISGDCKLICFNDSRNLVISDSSDIYCEGECSGTVGKCTSVVLGNGSDVTLYNCSYITVGRDDVSDMSNCRSVYTAGGNTLSLNGNNGLRVGRGNSYLSITGVNIVEDGNTAVTVTGQSNEIHSGNLDITVNGDINSVSASRYIQVGGHFNYVGDSEFSKTETAVGNSIRKAGTVDIRNTNNNLVEAVQIGIVEKDPFIKYMQVGGLTVAENLNSGINLVSDSHAVVLIADECNFRGAPETRSSKKYVIVNGIWTEIK